MRSHNPKIGERLFNREILADKLYAGVRALHLHLSQKQFDQLLDYLEMLNKWNAVYNLTAIRDPEAMITQHLLDALSAASAFEKAKHILDVGSGGGIPGIVLAIAKPYVHIDMIDTVQKKTAFLNQVKSELGLQNVTVHTGRVEQLTPTYLYDTITSRAFSSLADMIGLSAHLLAPAGCYIAMKGVVPKEEIEDMPKGWVVKNIKEIHVPQMKAERHLIFIERETK